jgi:hypothetical protein
MDFHLFMVLKELKGGRVKDRVKEGCILSKYFRYMYENRIMKPIKNWLKRGRGGDKKE